MGRGNYTVKSGVLGVRQAKLQGDAYLRMAGCPATTSGRHHVDCSWQGRGVLPSSRLISGPAHRRLQAAAPVADRECRRRRGACTTCAAATMAEEMVAEPRSAERRQIQQMLNR